VRQERRAAGKVAAESYGFFIYALGHYSFFGEHEPAKTDIWDEFKNRPKEFALPEGRPLDGVGDACPGSPTVARFRGCRDRPGNLPVAGGQYFARHAKFVNRAVQQKRSCRNSKDRDQKCARAKAERRDRLTELCMPRRPKVEAPKTSTVIRAAGHH